MISPKTLAFWRVNLLSLLRAEEKQRLKGSIYEVFKHSELSCSIREAPEYSVYRSHIHVSPPPLPNVWVIGMAAIVWWEHSDHDPLMLCCQTPLTPPADIVALILPPSWLVLLEIYWYHCTWQNGCTSIMSDINAWSVEPSIKYAGKEDNFRLVTKYLWQIQSHLDKCTVLAGCNKLFNIPKWNTEQFFVSVGYAVHTTIEVSKITLPPTFGPTNKLAKKLNSIVGLNSQVSSLCLRKYQGMNFTTSTVSHY